jgi:ABC-type Na+ efflux pump permease subunit
VVFKRRLILAFLSAIFADIALSFIIWILIMMGFSFFGLGDKLGSQINPLWLLSGISIILFFLLFWGFFVFIKPEKNKL